MLRRDEAIWDQFTPRVVVLPWPRDSLRECTRQYGTDLNRFRLKLKPFGQKVPFAQIQQQSSGSPFHLQHNLTASLSRRAPSCQDLRSRLAPYQAHLQSCWGDLVSASLSHLGSCSLKSSDQASYGQLKHWKLDSLHTLRKLHHPAPQGVFSQLFVLEVERCRGSGHTLSWSFGISSKGSWGWGALQSGRKRLCSMYFGSKGCDESNIVQYGLGSHVDHAETETSPAVSGISIWDMRMGTTNTREVAGFYLRLVCRLWRNYARLDTE